MNGGRQGGGNPGEHGGGGGAESGIHLMAGREAGERGTGSRRL